MDAARMASGDCPDYGDGELHAFGDDDTPSQPISDDVTDRFVDGDLNMSKVDAVKLEWKRYLEVSDMNDGRTSKERLDEFFTTQPEAEGMGPKRIAKLGSIINGDHVVTEEDLARWAAYRKQRDAEVAR
jgi:hypothetical protein